MAINYVRLSDGTNTVVPMAFIPFRVRPNEEYRLPVETNKAYLVTGEIASRKFCILVFARASDHTIVDIVAPDSLMTVSNGEGYIGFTHTVSGANYICGCIPLN